MFFFLNQNLLTFLWWDFIYSQFLVFIYQNTFLSSHFQLCIQFTIYFFSSSLWTLQIFQLFPIAGVKKLFWIGHCMTRWSVYFSRHLWRLFFGCSEIFSKKSPHPLKKIFNPSSLGLIGHLEAELSFVSSRKPFAKSLQIPPPPPDPTHRRCLVRVSQLCFKSYLSSSMFAFCFPEYSLGSLLISIFHVINSLPMYVSFPS